MLPWVGDSVSMATLTPCCLGSPEMTVHPTARIVNLRITFPVEMMVLYTL